MTAAPKPNEPAPNEPEFTPSQLKALRERFGNEDLDDLWTEMEAQLEREREKYARRYLALLHSPIDNALRLRAMERDWVAQGHKLPQLKNLVRKVHAVQGRARPRRNWEAVIVSCAVIGMIVTGLVGYWFGLPAPQIGIGP